jgi:hypothetical protein
MAGFGWWNGCHGRSLQFRVSIEALARCSSTRGGRLVDLGQSAESPQDVRKPPSAANGYQRIKVQVRTPLGASVRVSGRPLQLHPQVRRSGEPSRRAGGPRHTHRPAATFLDACVVAGLNILVAPGTQAGKTTIVKPCAETYVRHIKAGPPGAFTSTAVPRRRLARGATRRVHNLPTT